MEIIIQETKEGDSGEVFNVKLQSIPLKPEKVAKKGSEDSETSGNSNNRTIQVIDILAYRQVREIRESFEDLGEIEKLYIMGAGLYQVAFITFKNVDSVKYFNNIWSHHINKDIVRVLPLQLSKEECENRKKFSLRLSAVMIRGKYQRYHYAYVHFSSEKDLLAVQKMKIEFKKGNTSARQLYWSKEEDRICNICGNPDHMAKECNNKDINKSPTKKFVSRADNWKNLKKSYADVAKTKQKHKNEKGNVKSQLRDFLHQQHIINTIRQVEEKLSKTESLIGSTSKQINEIITAQQAIKCDKAHPVLTAVSKKKKDNKEIDTQAKKKKRQCKSDSESSDEDEDEVINKAALQTQRLQKSDQNIQTLVDQQKLIQENHKETKSLLSSLYEMLSGGPSASLLLGDDNEVLADAIV
ncbi:hypothetical protein C1646_770608 [Rhizophagus diaphanus]|nr:hypothetical protein C1646_770608 [Rhizophagus diaphanus] [Rhizophagus sp. MUCL 43196]